MPQIFVVILAGCGLPQSQPFAVLLDIHSAIIAKRRPKPISILESFRTSCAGYWQFTADKWQPSDHGRFEPITWEGQRYAILKRCYVAPLACTLLRDHASIIAGTLMDTTWRVIGLYVASILTVAAGNVGIPIALNFGPVENVELYDGFSLIFRSLFNLDLSTYVVESDQGSALGSICAKYGNQHTMCLRHLPVSLGRGPFAHEIGNLVKCRSRLDFDKLMQAYEARFLAVKESEQAALMKILHKIGLALGTEN
jgi:hypothetical protein